MTKPISFGILGTGWRAEFFLRIAQACPTLFQVTGICGRTPSKTAALAQRFGVRAFDDWRKLLGEPRPDFVVLSVARLAAPELMQQLVAAGMPVLSETPPAADIDGLNALYRALGSNAPVQIAEQYAFQPHHAARLTFLHGGKLGPISQAQVSVAHGYHGVNLMRRYLGVGFEPVALIAKRFASDVISGADRNGPPQREIKKSIEQDLVWFDYGAQAWRV